MIIIFLGFGLFDILYINHFFKKMDFTISIVHDTSYRLPTLSMIISAYKKELSTGEVTVDANGTQLLQYYMNLYKENAASYTLQMHSLGDYYPELADHSELWDSIEYC